MTELQRFLAELDNVELAKFIGYRFNDFLEPSRKLIIQEVKERGLTKSELTDLFNKKIPNTGKSDFVCEKCGSIKYYTETDYELKQSSYSSYEVVIESKKCRVCGLNQNKSRPKGLKNRIKKVFGFYRSTRLKRPEFDGNLFT